MALDANLCVWHCEETEPWKTGIWREHQKKGIVTFLLIFVYYLLCKLFLLSLLLINLLQTVQVHAFHWPVVVLHCTLFKSGSTGQKYFCNLLSSGLRNCTMGKKCELCERTTTDQASSLSGVGSWVTVLRWYLSERRSGGPYAVLWIYLTCIYRQSRCDSQWDKVSYFRC